MYLTFAFHITSYVISVMLPCSCLLVEPDFGYTNVGPGCVLLCIYNIAPGIAGFTPSRCDLSVLVKLQAASSICTQTGDFSMFRQPTRAASACQSRACLPCACLWTSTCMCLTELCGRASTHILRAFYSADIGIPWIQPPISALRALCLRSWPANWTVSLNLTVSSGRYKGYISSL